MNKMTAPVAQVDSRTLIIGYRLSVTFLCLNQIILHCTDNTVGMSLYNVGTINNGCSGLSVVFTQSIESNFGEVM